MVSKYFQIKTSEKKFNDRVKKLVTGLKNKKVLTFASNECYTGLNNIYKLSEKLNIIAISNENIITSKTKNSLKIMAPEDALKEDYDTILIMDENPKRTVKYLSDEISDKNKEIVTVFNEEIKDECENLNYLYKFHFDKTLPKLIKKLKNKKVVLYGAGAFLELIKKYFDLSGLNIIGVADRRFQWHESSEKFLGYKAYSPDEIKDLKPDYVLVATKMYVSIIEDLYYDTLKGTGIKIKPLMKKDFFSLLKEI